MAVERAPVDEPQVSAGGDLSTASEPVRESTVEINDCAAIVREMIRYESEQVHRRISWLATFQGLIFAAFGFSLNTAGYLRPVFAGLGMFVAFFALIGVGAAALATRRLHAYWEARASQYGGPPVDGFHQRRLALALLSPDLLLPAGFIVAWVAVILWR